MNLSIKHWPEQERPRERLIQQGAASLSDAELLAIFLRSGSKQHSAVELSRLLLQHFGGLNSILDAELQDLSQFHGIGVSKYAQLIAVKELGRRYISTHLQQEKIELSNSKILLDFLKFELLGEMQEVFAVLCLDAHLRKISFKKMFYGSLNSCEISTNQLLRYAIHQHASSIVIAHNHPLGIAQPSRADIELTRRILTACQLLEIKLIDHCIVSPEGTCSLAELGLI
ncbi:DNA repair protein RadC [Acinetobacter haemolyticus]|jgi:DNA repair protein RadC|uniref:RadC family protein n=1 Tax=unclassified Acinetobacter TaxID=196816 RepID=UPI0015D358E7|nr:MULTISPECIES: DNA repair protein RadC [unclassified Acinetobacter]QQN38958.1 DNA repair protein RadC [Acinetobacter sp. CS-2]UDM38708.1 DNA repair protein RadC [Acinetobacter haemolyticus]